MNASALLVAAFAVMATAFPIQSFKFPLMEPAPPGDVPRIPTVSSTDME